MASRVCPGLYLCGEICDVDGRIGGFIFNGVGKRLHGRLRCCDTVDYADNVFFICSR